MIKVARRLSQAGAGKRRHRRGLAGHSGFAVVRAPE
jgi:hypothetical protein